MSYLKEKNSGSGLEIREYGRRVRHADHVVPSIGKVGTNISTSGGRSVGTVRLRTQATEFFFLLFIRFFLVSLYVLQVKHFLLRVCYVPVFSCISVQHLFLSRGSVWNFTFIYMFCLAFQSWDEM
jgi:hypothetical protein